MARRQLQEINAGSMADIAFLLLIFFLITTTMDTDSGILRRLPPMPDQNTKDQTVDVKERNIFVVLVNRQNQLMVEGKPMDVRYLKDAAEEFIQNPLNKPNLPVREPVTVKYFGTVMTTPKAVISLQTDRGTSYKTYITVQNELTKAYDELWNQLSMQKFGKKFKDLDEVKDKDKIKAIEDIYPMKISEAEPKNVGG